MGWGRSGTPGRRQRRAGAAGHFTLPARTVAPNHSHCSAGAPHAVTRIEGMPLSWRARFGLGEDGSVFQHALTGHEDQLKSRAGVPGCGDTTRRGVVRVRRTTPADGMRDQDGARRTTAHRPTSRSKARNDNAPRQPNGLRMHCSSRALAPSERRYGPAHSSATNSHCPRVVAEVR